MTLHTLLIAWIPLFLTWFSLFFFSFTSQCSNRGGKCNKVSTHQKHMGDGDALWKLYDPVCCFIWREDESQREVGGSGQNVNLKHQTMKAGCPCKGKSRNNTAIQIKFTFGGEFLKIFIICLNKEVHIQTLTSTSGMTEGFSRKPRTLPSGSYIAIMWTSLAQLKILTFALVTCNVAHLIGSNVLLSFSQVLWG